MFYIKVVEVESTFYLIYSHSASYVEVATYTKPNISSSLVYLCINPVQSSSHLHRNFCLDGSDFVFAVDCRGNHLLTVDCSET